MLQADAHAIHFKRIFEFWRGTAPLLPLKTMEELFAIV